MNNKSDTFSIAGRIRSSVHAGEGIVELLKSQHNAWVELFATIGVTVAGWLFGVTAVEWCLLILVMMSVWVAEALNTAVEFLCDVASPEFHPLVKKSKDVAAGAVLLSVVGAAVVGTIIFLPYMLNLL
jgi:diacylglycerol kinase (ATP)